MKLFSAAQSATSHYRGILTRLRHDTSGNTLVMIATATIPLVGMTGSAVDVGRTYLIKSRLQQACDAGVLAARRSMATTTLDAGSIAKGQQFFRVNFSEGMAGSSNSVFTPTGTEDGQVSAVATARVPMTIAKMFGTEHIDLQVRCDARLDVANTDVMMVLDTTGSMAGSRIAALRLAVIDFHNTVTAATSPDKRYRIGFTAYSQAVNMGTDSFTNSALLADNWMVDTHTYQSRVAKMDLPGWAPTTSYGATTNQTYGSPISDSDCTKYGNNESFSGYNPASGTNVNTNNSNPNNAAAPTAILYQDAQPSDVRRTYSRVTASYSGNASCTRRWTRTTTDYALTGRFKFRNWDYKPVVYDVSSFRRGNSVNVYTGGAPSASVTTTVAAPYDMIAILSAPGVSLPATATRWSGCVEERRGNASNTFDPIPDDSWDLDINTTPDSNPDRKWRPMWPELVYDRTSSNNGADPELNSTANRGRPGSTCPSASSQLATRSSASVTAYVNALVATGSTYHDFGMAWGARLLSPTGMWAASNSSAPNGRAINRHLIFMTDGIMEPQSNTYGSQGYEKSDRRVVGTSVNPSGGASGNMAPLHTKRFLAMCNALRGNATIWTINFSGADQPSLVACADPGKAFTASNEAELRAQFQKIASQVAELRLAR